MSVPAIVLAAGGSRRMGHPKQLVRVDGETLIARTVRVLREGGADPVWVVLGAHAEEIREQSDLTAKVVVNETWESGMASSIHAGLRQLQQSVQTPSCVLLAVCDQPRLTPEHVRALIDAWGRSGQSATVASAYGGACGVPAIFPASEFSRLVRLSGDSGARRLLQDAGSDLVTVSFEEGIVDLDTPEDLDAHQGMI